MKALVPYSNAYRRMWMFPRNIRRIYPWKIAQISALLKEQLQSIEWAGNQPLQNAFCKALEASNLKKLGNQRDANSGGPRTYVAQLKCLGIVFQREKGSIDFTLAGEKIANGEAPLPILQRLVLRNQYPSAYGNLRNVAIHPGIRIKPFLFICRLLLDKSIRFLTEKELAIPIIYGHNVDCYQKCKEKILKIRSGAKIEDCIDDVEYDLYTPRTKKRTLKATIDDIGHIANTLKNYLHATCIIESCNDQFHKYSAFQLSGEVIDIVRDEMDREDQLIKYEHEEQFQRKYGTISSQKDTRNLADLPAVKRNEGAHIIIALYFQLCAESVTFGIPDEFVERITKQYGFSRGFIQETLQPFTKNSLSIFESSYIEMSKGGQRVAREFEISTGNLIKDKLRFRTKHTGQKKRRRGIGGYADIIAIALDDRHCALFDTKATPHYQLTSDDYYKLVNNYLKNYEELLPDIKYRLEFFTYVAGGFSGDIEHKLNNAEKESGVPISAIKAYDLLKLCMQDVDQNMQVRVRKLFSQSKILTNSSL